MTDDRVRSQAAMLHIPVVQLKTPRAWRVGRVTFKPAGWLAGYCRPGLESSPASNRPFLEDAQKGIEEHSASTAAVRVRWPGHNADPVLDAAIEDVRDALAVLLLFQHWRHPQLNTDLQQFGVHGDVGGAIQRYTVTDRRRVQAWGIRHVGIFGNWEFSKADADVFATDHRFRYIDNALRARGQRTELQRRVLTAIRALGLASTTPRPQVKVVLLATAVEALVSPDNPLDLRGEYLRIAQRAAYLVCGEPDHRYPSRPPCFYLQTTSLRALKNVLEDRQTQGKPSECSTFRHYYGLLNDRNDALHKAKERFDRSRVYWHARYAETLVLYLVEWAIAHPSAGLGDLLAEIDAFAHP